MVMEDAEAIAERQDKANHMQFGHVDEIIGGDKIMVNFNIIEGDYGSITDYPLDDIIVDYTNPNYTVTEIRRKYSIYKASEWSKIKEHLKNEGVQLRKKGKNKYHKNKPNRIKCLPLDDIKKDYLYSDLTVKDIREKYGLNYSLWYLIRDYFKEMNIPLRKTGPSNNVKYYYFHKGVDRKKPWEVLRTFNGRTIFFGCYATEEEAQKRVKFLHENNWEGHL